MAEDYYTQYCREHTDAEARAFLIDQLRKADSRLAALTEAVAAIQRIAEKRCGDCGGLKEPGACEPCVNSAYLEIADGALSSNSAFATQLLEEARIGRAVVEWHKKQGVPVIAGTVRDAAAGFQACLDALGVIISQAREGKV